MKSREDVEDPIRDSSTPVEVGESANSTETIDVPMILEKLETINSLRSKTLQLENLKSALKQEVESAESEDDYLQEYRAELEALVQEKMAHVEELRLIHADINLLETTIRQAKEDKFAAFDKAKKLLLEYNQIKSHADSLRASLGLERQPESLHVNLERFQEEEADMPEWCSSSQESNAPVGGLHVSSTSLSAGVSGLGGPLKHDSSSLRQQPPPMKSCQSCQQQIHRNAPICPLCKAKSRSRNPKKPKRKPDY